jgi:hypothetical protein
MSVLFWTVAVAMAAEAARFLMGRFKVRAA